jgi:2,3-bisphosphoglycerate-independent phosphoglycerate mutase
MSTPPSVYFFFVDGVGVGPGGTANPLDTGYLKGIHALTGDQPLLQGHFDDASGITDGLPWLTRPIDANLGLDGLPQSGTGQATLFTGINCARIAGRHYGPFPHSTSRPIIAEHNLFNRVGAERSAFANAYPDRFFEWTRKRDRWPTTTRCCLDSGVRIRTLKDLREGTAIAADLTGKGLADIAASPIPLLDEDSTAQRIAKLVRTYRLVVSEYFHTDKAGHAQDPFAAKQCLTAIDRFLAGLVTALDFRHTTLVITSDHGNMEDLSVKSHTRNPVPLIVAGPGWHHFERVEDLTGVAEAIMCVLEDKDA